jgi:uncharacterized membrane protein YwzB
LGSIQEKVRKFLLLCHYFWGMSKITFDTDIKKTKTYDFRILVTTTLCHLKIAKLLLAHQWAG